MPDKRALIVAINDYPGERNDLPSCIDDALAFERILTERYGFSADRMRRHVDGAATLATVSDSLFNWLLKDVQADDRVVFYYSGHGFRTERDGVLRECLCLHDDFLFDQDLVRQTQAIPPGTFTMVIDACHSGGMSKPFFVEQPGVELTENKVWRPDAPEMDAIAAAEKSFTPIKAFGRAPVTLAATPLEAAKTFRTDALVRDAQLAEQADPELYPVPDAADDAADPDELELNGLLVSACLAEQTAAASTAATTSPDRSERLSAFTFALRRSLDGLAQSEGSVERVSTRRLMDATAAELKRLGFRQTPLLQETGRSTGLAAHAFITMRPVGGGTPVPATPTPATPIPATPIPTAPTAGESFLTSPAFERLLAELARALAPTNGTSSDATRTPVGRI